MDDLIRNKIDRLRAANTHRGRLNQTVSYAISVLEDLRREVEAAGVRPVLSAAPQAQPHSLISDEQYLQMFMDAKAGSERPAGYLRGIRRVIAAYEAAAPQAQPVEAVLRECELFLRVLGLDSEPAAALAAECRAVLPATATAPTQAQPVAPRAFRTPEPGTPWWQTAKDCGAWTDRSEGDVGYVHFGSVEALRVYTMKVCNQARAALVPPLTNAARDVLAEIERLDRAGIGSKGGA